MKKQVKLDNTTQCMNLTVLYQLFTRRDSIYLISKLCVLII